MAGLSISVRSSASSKERAAKQSASSTNAKDNGSPATSETKAANQKAQPGAVALGDLSPMRANNHWSASNRFRFASPAAAATLTATKTDAIVVDTDNDTKADPGDTLEYTVTINNTSPSMDATNVIFTDTLTDTNLMFVPGSVKASPVAVNDTYPQTLVGNVSINSATISYSVVTNDFLGINPEATITAFDATSANGGNVTMTTSGAGMGQFTYNPPAGFEGTDTFTYTLSSSNGSNTATVSIPISGMVWFINNNGGACASNCDGRLSNPFQSLSAFQTVNDGVGNHPDDGDNIFIYESATNYTGPVTLLDGQDLIGQDATASLETITGLTPPTSSPSFPTMNSGNGTIVKITSAANAINLSSVATLGELIRGLTVGSTTGIGINGTGFGTLTVLDVNMDDSPNRTGQALALTNGTLAATFANIKSTNPTGAGSSNGIALTNVTGSLTSGSTSITNPSLIGISIGTSSATFSFGNTSVTQSGNTGISLTSNSGAITFGTLNITPDSNQRGLLATENSNTITASGGAITTSGGVAVEITKSSTTTPLVISLTSVSANGGTNGIVLSRTSGSFTVVGNSSGQCGGSATANSGTTPGTATAPVTGDCTGGTIQSTSGFGISLNNVTNVSLTRMWVKSAGDDGIHGSTVDGFSLISSFVENNGNGPNEHGIDLVQLLGTCAITNSKVSGSSDNNVFVNNTAAGTLSALNITGSQFSATSPTTGADGILIKPQSTSNVTVSVSSSFFSNNRDNHIQMAPTDSAVSKITINNNTFTDNTATTLGGDIVINPVSNTNTKAIVTNNDISGAVLSPLNFNLGVGSTAASVFHVTATGNFIGNTGVNSSGSETANGIQVWGNGEGTINAIVSNNDVRQFNHFYGINVAHQDGNGFINLTMKGNLVTEKDNSGLLLDGIRIEAGAVNTDAGTICADIGDPTVAANKNTISTTPNGGADLRIRLRINAKMTFPGYGGGASNTTDLQNYLAARNILSTVSATTSSAAATPFGNAGAGCTQPSTRMASPSGDLASSAIGSSDRQIQETEDILWATHGTGRGGNNLHKLTQAELMATMQAAIERWRETGISAQDLMRLQAMTFEIVDLPDGQLAAATSTHVKIDETAAKYGWYFDTAPMDDTEFDVAVPGRELQTTERSPAFGRVDLLTVVMRELGVAYRHGKKSVIKGLRPLMENSLSPAVRRLPKSQNITLPTPSVGGSAASQSSDTASLISQAGEVATSQQKTEYLAHGRSARRLNHAAIKRAGVGSPSALLVAPDVTTNISTLPALKNVVIKFRAQIKDPLVTAASSVSNQGRVQADGGIDFMTDDPDAPGASNPTVTPLDVADVKVTKTDSIDPVLAGNNLTYTVTVTNDGPSDATAVQLTDNLPTDATVTFVSGQQTSVTPIFNCTYPLVNSSGGTVTCTIATLAAGASGTFEIVLKVGASTANNTSLSNTATVTTTKTDPDSTNNTKTETTLVHARADLKMDKVGPPTGNVGDPTGFDYTLTVTNQGPSNNTGGFTVTDTLPTGVTFQTTGSSSECSAVGQVVTCTDNTGLAVLGTKVFTLHVTIDPAVVGGTDLLNSATVASNGTIDQTSGNNTSTPVSTIAQANADLSIAKSGPSTAVAGAPAGYDYTITVTNNGPSSQTGGFTVTDTLPTGLTFHSTGSSSECSAVGQVVTCTTVTGLAVLGNKQFTVHVTVSPSVADGTVLSNTASVASNGTTDPISANNNTTLTPVNTTIETSADIEVTKTDSPDPVIAGNELTYTVTITNNGPSDAQNVNLTDGVPANTTFVSAAQNTGPTFSCTNPSVGSSTGNVSCSITTLASGASATFEIKVKVDANAADGSSISNTATGSSDTDDPVANNTADTETTQVQTRADLSIAKSGPATAVAGAAAGFDYTITVTNNGPSNNTGGSVVSDTLPGGLTFQSVGSSSECSAVGQAVTCTDNAGMAVNGTKQFTVHVTLGSFVLDGTVLSNTASVASGGTTDPTSGNDASTAVNTTAQAEADLKVSKTASPDPAVAAGANLTYTITVTNDGPSDVQDPELTDSVPTDTTFVSFSVPAGWSRTDNPLVGVGGTGTVTVKASTLAAGASAQFTFVVKVDADTTSGSNIGNTATVSSGTTDTDSSNDTDSTTTSVTTSADIEVTKTASPDPAVTAGANLTYTVTITNNGPSDAQSVSLTDGVPADTTFVSVAQGVGATFSCTDPGAGSSTGNVSCTRSTLAAGESQTFTIIVLVDADAASGSEISNTATGDSTTSDPTPGNNSKEKKTTVETSADLSIVKVGPATAVAGAAAGYDYTLTVTNNGPSNNTGGLTVKDTLPTGLTFQTTGSSPECSAVGQAVTCSDNAGMAVLGTKQFTIHVTVGSSVSNGTVLQNSAKVESDGTTNPANGDTSSTVDTTVQAVANLKVTKTDSPDPVIAGNELTYTITVTNNGPSDAQSLLLSDPIPSNTTFVSFSVPVGWSRTDNPLIGVGGTGTVKAETSTLAAGASAQFTFVVKVDAGTSGGTILTNVATATTATTDPDLNDNAGTTTATVDSRPDMSIKEIEMSDQADPLMIGENITYHIVVTNKGPSNATGVKLTDTMPSSSSFISATPSVGSGCAQVPGEPFKVICDLGNMNSGASATVDIVVKSLGNPNTILNAARVDANEADSDGSNNSDTELTTLVGFRYLTILDPVIMTGGCQNTVGKLSFTGPAPAGVEIKFALSSTSVALIPKVTTVGNEEFILFDVKSKVVFADQTVEITASTTRGPNSKTAKVKVLPVRVSSLTFNQNPVQGGTTVTATLTLACAATKKIVVQLSSSRGAATLSKTQIEFPIGTTSKQFTITTKNPGIPVIATILAVDSNGGRVASDLKINP
jgi:uncharacterized repeat protein (TIGR01451 family)